MDVSMSRMRTYSRANILQRFQEHCQSLEANGNAGYQREFHELSETGKYLPCTAGELGANKEKNRHPCVLPYDHCRVKLSLLDSQPYSDYINASFVPGGCTEQDFICTQAPLQSTMADFWRMVWEQNVQVIVMLTAFKENGKIMCNQYWPPERGTGCYGALQVTTVSHHHGPDSYITSIQLRYRGCPTERHITHYHYPGWPDQGVPKAHVSLCTFTEYVRKHMDNSPSLGPTVVHCSAGVGRSGSFVALLWLMQLCVRGILPNVYMAVQDLRKHRILMVQKLEQYMLVHLCLLHWLGGNMNRQRFYSTAVSENNLQEIKNRTVSSSELSLDKTQWVGSQTGVVQSQATHPEKHSRSKRHSRSRHLDHLFYPESAHFSHQLAHTSWPQHTPLSQHTPISQNKPWFQYTTQSKHTPNPVHTSRPQHTPQPKDSSLHQHPLLLKYTPESEQTQRHENTSRPQHKQQPQEIEQQTTWRTLQNSLHVLHPRKLLQRILPSSSRLSLFTSGNTNMGQ